MTTFTRKQLVALREIAERATQSEWRAFISPGTDTYAVHTPEDERCGDIINWPGFDGRKNAKNNAEFIAVFNPKVVLALLDVLDASLDAKPVAKIIAHYPLGIDAGKQKFVQAIGELPDFGGYLFAAPPVPVVPEEISMASKLPLMSDQLMALGYVKGWNACRATMLKRKGE